MKLTNATTCNGCRSLEYDAHHKRHFCDFGKTIRLRSDGEHFPLHPPCHKSTTWAAWQEGRSDYNRVGRFRSHCLGDKTVQAIDLYGDSVEKVYDP